MHRHSSRYAQQGMIMNAIGFSGAWWIWPVVAALYVLFRAWYDNWRKPLSTQEVAHYMRLIQTSPGTEHTDPQVLRQFLARDDGKEFVMCNLVRLHAQPVPHPLTGVLTPPRQLIQEYFRPFAVTLFLHGGHPVVTSRKVAGYIDSWNVPPDPGWTMVGMMRYRSRRDMMELTLNPRFMKAYPFKAAAVEQTYSFPTQILSTMVLQPRSGVALGLALMAALVHLVSLL
jgi:hypothetical protein